MAEIRTRRTVLAAKVEVTVGTAETLSAAESLLLVYDAKFDASIPMFDRRLMDASISPFTPIPGTQMAKLTFKVEIKGSGTAGTAPALGLFLKACGMGETLVAVTSATYAPISTAYPSLTIAMYRDGLKKSIRGARGTCKVTGKVGEPMMLEFEIQGVYNGVTDVAILTPTVETTLPPALLSASFTMHSFAAKVSNVNFDLGNTLTMREDISKAEGFFACLVTSRDPKGSMDPEEELVATHDFYGRWKAGTTGALSMVVGAVAGNICTIAAPKVAYTKISDGDRNGLAILGLDFAMIRSLAAGNDEFTLAFT
jgi:hypothetical protein